MMNKINYSIGNRRAMWAACLLVFSFMLARPDNAQAQWVTNGNNINNTNTGNVGIGTTNPVVKLSVVGEILSEGPVASNSFRDRTSGRGWVWYGTGDVARFWNNEFGNLVGITASGNVGIGTMTPASKLEVIGNIALSPNSRITSLADWGNYVMPYESVTGRMAFRTAGVDRMSILYNGNVGIGTNAPLGPLSVGDSAVANSDGYLVLGKRNGGGGTRHFRVGFDSSFNFVIGDYGNSNIAGTWLSPFAINWQAPNNSLYINSVGNVGIGTNTPTSRLHVAGDGKVTGNLTVDGNIAAKYQDVAEWVLASERIPVGTVVILDSAKSNQVISSREAYDTRVAGVVSDTPGIILGEGGEGKVMVATTGRVRVKVDATRGPIRVGDLLVTSDKEGIAMRSEPLSLGGTPIHRPGTLIGKALEPLDKGIGEILVLLSLQ